MVIWLTHEMGHMGMQVRGGSLTGGQTLSSDHLIGHMTKIKTEQQNNFAISVNVCVLLKYILIIMHMSVVCVYMSVYCMPIPDNQFSSGSFYFCLLYNILYAKLLLFALLHNKECCNCRLYYL